MPFVRTLPLTLIQALYHSRSVAETVPFTCLDGLPWGLTVVKVYKMILACLLSEWQLFIGDLMNVRRRPGKAGGSGSKA